MSIRQILFLSIIGLMAITVSAITFSTYQTNEKVLIEHAHQIMDTVSSEAIERSKAFLRPAELAARLTQRLADHEVVSSSNVEAMERYFFEQLSLYPQFAGIYFAQPDGSFVYVMRDESRGPEGYRSKIIRQVDGRRQVELTWRDSRFRATARKRDDGDSFDPRKRPWYHKAVDEGRQVWTEPYIYFTSKKPGITISSPVFNQNRDRSLRGVVGIDIEIDEISNFLAKLKIGTRGSALIVDDRGQVLAHPDPSKIKRRAGENELTFTRITEIDDPVARAAFRSLKLPPGQGYRIEGKRITRFIHDGVAYQASFTPFLQHQWPWIFAIQVPEDDYLGVFHDNQRFNILIAIVITVIASLLGILLAHSLGKPILQLGEQSRAIMRGEWDEARPIHTRFREIRETTEAFAAMARTLKQQQDENRALNKTLQKNSLATIFRLSQAAEYKNPTPQIHLSRMAQLAALIARQMEQDRAWCEMILHAAPMHDIGNLGIPDQILLKPGKLDLQEWEVIKTHPLIGAEILKNPETDMLAMARRIILTHHERWNGFGYPRGLAGNDIPLEGRICAVADAFDSMASDRVYQPASELDQVFREIRAGRGSHFDPRVVDALLDIELEVRRLYSDIPTLDQIF
jgi:putative two-component system response regulator